MLTPLLTSAAFWPLEKLINAIIKTDPHALRSLEVLAGKQIELETDSPQFNLCLVFTGYEVQLRPLSSKDLATQSDATISSDPATLFGLLLAAQEERPLANPKLKISGDAQLVQSAFNLAKALDIRWDDLLAPFAGSAFTHRLKTSADELQQWSQRSSKALKSSVDDYLKEESKILPSPYSIEEFQDRLDQLRLRIDRAQARAERLLPLGDDG